MDLPIFRLGLTLAVFLVCDPQRCWANEEVTHQSYISELRKGHPENPSALYEVLKNKSKEDQWIDVHNLTVTEEDLINAQTDVASNIDPKIALYRYGYLNMTSAPKTSNGLYSLDFTRLGYETSRAGKIKVCADLMVVAQAKDADVKNACLIGNTTFERMPPDSDSVKSFMLALGTIMSSIPLRFHDWQHSAVFGALYMLDLSNGVHYGNGPLNHRVLYGENLPNNTRLLLVMEDLHNNATHSWHSYYQDLMFPILPRSPHKNLLVILVIVKHPRLIKNAFSDWYGVYQDSDHRVLQEYEP